MLFYQYIQGAEQPVTMSLEQVFAWNIRFQVLVRNQEEYDLLSAYQLMFGREIQIDIWDEWVKPIPTLKMTDTSISIGSVHRKLLPFTFTTWSGMDMREYA